jgi:hypothetical protein
MSRIVLPAIRGAILVANLTNMTGDLDHHCGMTAAAMPQPTRQPIGRSQVILAAKFRPVIRRPRFASDQRPRDLRQCDEKVSVLLRHHERVDHTVPDS